MPGISTALCALKIGLFLSPVALVLTAVGMATPFWLEDKENHFMNVGLWEICRVTPSTLNFSVCTSYIYLGQDEYPGKDTCIQLVTK